MKLHEELYFEIALEGSIENLRKFEAFAKSGAFSDFFEVFDEYFIYDEDYSDNDTEGRLIFSNDDYGIEIDRFDTDEFLDLFCSGASALDVVGNIYDINDDEYRFESPKGKSAFYDQDNVSIFNDELDEEARKEDLDDSDEEE